MNQSLRLGVSAVIVLVGFAAVFALSNFTESKRPPLPAGYEDQDLALQGGRLKNYSLGFNGLMADWYWMQSLQYLGGKIVNTDKNVNLEDLRDLNPRLLYPMLDNATTLDPQFTAAYAYGAVVLPAIDQKQAIAIAEKGVANNPNEWRLYQHLGYIYWRLADYQKAADTYQKGSEIPGAPAFMKMMAAQMRNQGGSRDTARKIYREMLESAEDSQTRENAQVRLLQLDSLDEQDAINAALKQFSERTGRCANSWNEIIPALRTVTLPDGRDFSVDRSNNLVDPTGAPYILDKQSCAVMIDRERSKLPRK
jgi:tetratricopeptide (TPR) repeat protein